MKSEQETLAGEGKAAKPSSRSAEPEMKAKYESMKLWFDVAFVEDRRTDVIVEINRIINVESEKLDALPIGRLLNAETRLIQLNLTLGELVADATGKFNFAYVYRKFQQANTWSKMKESLIIDGKRITNGEVDAATEQKMFEERCIETFMQHRADTYNNILDASRAFINSIRSRVKERDRQLRTPEEHRVYD